MSTVEDVARNVAGLVSVDIDVLLVGEWVAQRVHEIASAATLQSRYRTGELTIPATYSTGTLSVTRNAKQVTGTSTVWTQDMVGRHIRPRIAWYEIASVESATSLTLVSAFSEDTVTAGSYVIAARRHRLHEEARQLGQFMHMRLRRPLYTVSLIGLDQAFPSRFSVSTVPAWVAEVEVADDNVRQVEIYPFVSTTEIIHYEYWADLPQLTFRQHIPGFIYIEALREGVLIDVYRWLMSQAATAGKIEEAALWRNELRAQETRWLTEHRTRVLRQDSGTDDQEFILERRPAHPRRYSDASIYDAYTEIWYGR
jgi:hypothetical protein